MNHTKMSKQQIQVYGRLYKIRSFGSKLDPSVPAAGSLPFTVAVSDAPVLLASFSSPSQGATAALAMLRTGMG